MFVNGISGTLMEIKKSDQTRFEYVVWFPFTRSSMGIIREGSLITAKNFSSDAQTDRYSVMRITSVLPSHYALGTGLSGYPGFVEEAAVNASKDWSQEKPTEDTTKIVCEAIPSSYEIKHANPLTADQYDPEITPESNIPMLGEKTRLLNDEWMTRVMNRDIQKMKDRTITLGHLTNSANVDILALWDDMIRTHFGVFAYTNAGKSNLLSTLTSKVFESADEVKIVIYDLMGEYGALLIDVLYANPDAAIVYLSPQAMPDSVQTFWKRRTDEYLGEAAKDIVNTTILPKALKEKQADFVPVMERLLSTSQIKIMKPAGNLTDYFSNAIENSMSGRSVALDDFADRMHEINTQKDTTTVNVDMLRSEIRDYEFPRSSSTYAKQAARKLQQQLDQLRRQIEYTGSIDTRFLLSQEDMMKSLNTRGKKSLYILQDGNDALVRQMSYELGNNMLMARRASGQISPLVSFIYDEADQFIAQDSSEPGMNDSKKAAQQLARRGRKYGLGVGIATQRIVYLDTNILGQPHTYLVSKLPRATDRERIQEAFGLPDTVLSESLRFGPGQWLLISHSATGIDGLPIPIQLPDANARIINFLDGLGGEQTA